MPDFDIRKQFENGLSFTKIIVNILTYSGSLFLGLYWASLFSETINAYIPQGQGIFQKIGIGLLVTVTFAIGFYALIKYEKQHEKRHS